MTNRAQLYEYKGNCCACCGLAVKAMLEKYGTFSRMFQFHHIDPDTKDRHYKRLMAQRLSRRQMDEIDQCILLCTQCHATIHAQEIRGTLELSIQLGTRFVRQSFQGWVVADRVSRNLTFVTNEPYKLHPCEVRIKDQEPICLCASEVESHVYSWLQKMELHIDIEVFSLRDRKTVLRLKHVEGNRIFVEQSINFPSIQLDFHAHNVKDEYIYIRNGFALMASGAVHSTGIASYEMRLN